MLRYVLTANAPETKDNDFTWADFQARNNNELVAILGNFVNRALVLTHKFFGGVVPAAGDLTDADRQALEEMKAAIKAETEALDTFHFREALKQAMEIARTGNRYLQETEPWRVAKTDLTRTGTILNIALQICANIAIAFEPFIPFTASRLAGMLRIKDLRWQDLGSVSLVSPGMELGQPELLFEKIEDTVIQGQVQKLLDTKKANEIAAWKPQPQAEEVDFDTFCRSDLRVGTVLECTKVPKADKLLRFLIDDGMEKRTIVSGIAKYYNPEDLIGKQVCFIANLPVRKLKGIESQGMILSAENSDGSIVLLTPSAQVAPGSKIG